MKTTVLCDICEEPLTAENPGLIVQGVLLAPVAPFNGGIFGSGSDAKKLLDDVEKRGLCAECYKALTTQIWS